MVRGQQPGFQGVPLVEIVQFRIRRDDCARRCTHDYCTFCVCSWEAAGWFCSPAVPVGGWLKDLT